MKRVCYSPRCILWMCIISSCLITGLLSDHQALASELNENILLNANFEELEGGNPVAWEASDRWRSGLIAASENAARTGAQGIEIKIDNTDDYWARQTVAVEGGKMYELSAWLKNSVQSPGRGKIKVEFYRDTTDAIGWRGQQESEDFGYLENWEQVSVSMTIPDDANVAQVYIRLYGPGIALYDDVSFRKIEHTPGIEIFTDRVFYYEELTEGVISTKVWPEDGIYEDKSVDLEIYPQGGGASVIKETGLEALESFAYKFDPSMLTLQSPYQVKLTLRSELGESIFEEEKTIYRWQRPTSLREDGVLMVDGEPFFPRMGYHVSVAPFEDVTGSADWAKQAIGKAYRLSLVEGRGEGQFVPEGLANRAESAQLIFNLIASIGK